MALMLTLVPGLAVLAGAARAWSAGHHRVKVVGEGPATVVFEAGLGDTFEVWRQVQSRVARHCAHTFAYNRAGYAGSGVASGPRDAETLVTELREALAARGLRPPYVLVGHSLGGLYLQYFVRRYPEEIQGLVLVDATHRDHLARMREEAPSMYRTIRTVSLVMPGVMRRELADSERAGRQVAGLPPPLVPTIVLSSTEASLGETAAFRRLQRRLQLELAAEYRAQRHEFVAGSRHYIQRERPQMVIAAARELAGCSP